MSTVTTYHDWREAFRLRACELAQRGWSQAAIAEAFGVTQSAVSKWLTREQTEGREALHTRKPPGRPPQLTEAQFVLLRSWLTEGAEAHGFQGDVWTSPRIASLITRHFALTLSDRQVRRVLHQLGWTRQTPERRATQRDEEAITRWLTERWPHLKRAARRQRRTILFVDETGVYLLPGLVRTWAPRGETPLIHSVLSKAHLSLISAVSPDGQVYYHLQQQAYDSVAVTHFLDQLHTSVPGKLWIIWDGAPIHHGNVIDAYVAQAAAWLRIERLPGYAPELNPDEQVGRYIKDVELQNVTAPSLAVLEALVIIALQHLLGKTEIIDAFFRQAKLMT